MLKVILGGRRSGKTTKLIQLAAETGATMVVLHRRRCDQLKQMAKDMGIEIKTPITFGDYMRPEFHRGREYSGFVIDDLEILLDGGCSAPVIAVSATAELWQTTYTVSIGEGLPSLQRRIINADKEDVSQTPHTPRLPDRRAKESEV